MKQSIHTKINWFDRHEIESLLEGNGMACYASESTEDLRDTLRECVKDGDIVLDDMTQEEIESLVGESMEDMGLEEYFDV